MMKKIIPVFLLFLGSFLFARGEEKQELGNLEWEITELSLQETIRDILPDSAEDKGDATEKTLTEIPMAEVPTAETLLAETPIDAEIPLQNPQAEPKKAVSEDPPPANIKGFNTIRYGTESEIAALIQKLKNENDSSLDNVLLELADTSRNRSILTGIFTFFGEREKTGLENRTIKIIEERDYEANETILAAIDYLGKVHSANAVPILKELIHAGENRFLNNAIRALGRAGKGSEQAGDEAALFLLDYYTDGFPSNENQREIIVALGETGSSLGVSFLSDLIQDNNERAVLRMAALESMSKIEDPDGLDAIIGAVSSQDPNVRSYAIAALGPFPGEEANKAILEGFRDSYYRTRIGAAMAAGKRKLVTAIPFLRFRAENDDVPAVKDEAIKALGAIWNNEAKEILEALCFERNNPDRVRILSGEMILQNASAEFSSRVIAELDDSKARNQSALYNGLLRILGQATSPDLESLARRFLIAGTVTEKSYALDIALNNSFNALENNIRYLLDERVNGSGLARKAQITLDKMGFN